MKSETRFYAVSLTIVVTAMVLVGLASAKAADANVCRDYERQQQDRDQCIKKEGQNSPRCLELSDLDWSKDELAACKAKPVPARPAKPIAFQPPLPRIWQCNDIRVTETVLQPGIVNYDLGGTIWGGSQFTLNIQAGHLYFNGRLCAPLR